MSELLAPDPSASLAEAEHTAARLLREALRGMRFGTVTFIVQDGLVIQVERTEKTRVRRRPSPSTQASRDCAP